MKRARRMMGPGVMLIVLGAASISRFGGGVRNVAIVGLAGGGFALGVGLTFLITALLRRATPQ